MPNTMDIVACMRSSAGVSLSYLQLMKVRIVFMVLVACSTGWLLAGGKGNSLSFLLAGTALLTAGACVLNQYLEREADGLMERTRNRPLPSGRIRPVNALAFGLVLLLAGISLLSCKTNGLTALVGLLGGATYLLFYTPIKRLSWTSVPLGAMSGALPALMGWTSVRCQINTEAWLLFATLFCWQQVHFYAIAWLFQEDYRRAGFRMLPPGERGALGGIVLSALALAGLSMALVKVGLVGPVAGLGSLIAGLVLFGLGLGLYGLRSQGAARAVALASLLYWPLVLGCVWFDRCEDQSAQRGPEWRCAVATERSSL